MILHIARDEKFIDRAIELFVYFWYEKKQNKLIKANFFHIMEQ